MKKLLTTLVIFFICAQLFAQQAQVMFYGYVEQGQLESTAASNKKKKKTAPKLAQVKMYVYAGSEIISTSDVRETGFFATVLPSGKNYHIVFEKEGYFCKSFELDCTEVTRPNDDTAIKCLVDVSLFEKVDDADLLNLCNVPFAKAKFDAEKKEMEWDMDYTEKIKTQFELLAQPYYTALK